MYSSKECSLGSWIDCNFNSDTSEVYLRSCRASVIESSCENIELILAVNYFFA